MSDTHGHAHHDDAHQAAPPAPIGELRLVSAVTDGGHEIDIPPNRNLFAFLGVMVVLMIASAIGVYQLFVTHSESTLSDAAQIPSSQLEAQHARDKNFATTYGKVEVEGKLVAYRVPFADAKAMVLTDAARFSAAPPPADWIHPDDAGKK